MRESICRFVCQCLRPGRWKFLRTALEGLLATPSPAALALSARSEDDSSPGLAAAAPHLVYCLGLDDVVEGRFLAAAKATNWRYILLEGNNAPAAAGLAINDEGEVGGFAYVDRGPFVESTGVATALAEGLESVQERDYELRLLSVPSLYLVALWLHGEDNLLLPLAPAPGGLESLQPYTEEQLFAALQELIERRTSFVDLMP